VHELERLLDEARTDGLAESRTRERWLRHQATATATLLGSLLDLAETGASVAVSLLGGRRHDGRLVGVGDDVVVLVERSEHVVVRTEAIALVRTAPGTTAGPAAGARPAALDLHAGELLARLADGAPDVALALVSGDVVGGRLLAAGADVLSVRVADGDAGIVYCPLRSVGSARLRSG
jgi:hypothetical protein